MKKSIYLALSMMLVLGAFTACGGGKDKDNDTSTPDSVTSEDVGGSEGGETSEGGEVIEPVEIPEDLDVAGAIAFGKDYASRVTHGAGALVYEYNDPDYGFTNTESIIYALNDEFVYTNTISDSEDAGSKECWFSLDANGDIFAVKNGGPYDEEPSEDMMNGYAFNGSYIANVYETFYGVESLVSSLYTMARDSYDYYQQCLEDAQLAEDATLIANVEYVIANCGYSEMATEVEGQKVYGFSFRSGDYYVYEVNVAFTLSEYGYIETLSINTESYSPDFYTVETKEVTLADEESGVPAATVDVLVKNTEATVNTVYTVAVQQNVELDGVELPTENAYAADAVLATDFTMSKDGEAVESGAVLELRVGDKVEFDVTLSEGAVMAFNKPVFTIDGEVPDWWDARMVLAARNEYDDNGVATMNGIIMTVKQTGEFTVSVKIGASEEKTITVKVAEILPTYIDVYSKDANYNEIDEATVYVGVAVPLYVSVTEYASDLHTLQLDDETNASISENDEGQTVFVATAPGTYTITARSSVVDTLVDTITITVEAIPELSEILTGEWAVDYGQEKYNVKFIEDNKVVITYDYVADETYDETIEDWVQTWEKLVSTYSYTLDGMNIALTLVDGTDLRLQLVFTDTLGLAVRVENQWMPGMTYDINLTKVEVSEGGEEEVTGVAANVVGTWTADGASLSFNADGTGTITIGDYTSDFTWTASETLSWGAYPLTVSGLAANCPANEIVAFEINADGTSILLAAFEVVNDGMPTEWTFVKA